MQHARPHTHARTHTQTYTKSQEHVSHNWCDYAVKIWEWWKYVWTVPRERSIVTVSTFHFREVVLWQMCWWEPLLTVGQPWQREFSRVGNKTNDAQMWFSRIWFSFCLYSGQQQQTNRDQKDMCNICDVPVRASRWIRSQRWLLSRTLLWAHSATAAEPYKRWKGQQRAKSNHLFAQASRDAEDWRTVQEKVFRGCILSALTSYVSNKKHTVKGFVKTVQEVWSQLPIGREHFHMKVTNKHQFWVSDQGVAVHKLWRQKNVFQPITKVETNSHWMYANTSINPQSQKVCIFAKCLVLFWFSECQVEVQEWQMNHPLCRFF